MSFQSTVFIAFFCVLLSILFITKRESVRQVEILIASGIFYGLWDIRFLLLLMVCIVIMRCSVALIIRLKEHNATGKTPMVLGIVSLLLILGVFKYLGFFISGFSKLLGLSESGATINIFLPIGISFYIFSAIGYIIDSYRGDIDEQPSVLKEALYIMFFPKILQGPLQNAVDFFNQLKKEHPIELRNLESGIQIFLFGLIKKVVIADRLGRFVDSVFACPSAYSGATLALAVLTYPFQLYCDFSGYSDMAVATAKMMGYDLTQNFNLPFLSQNVAEFWRRWHMSLNIWFRDYLFYPILRSNWVNGLRKRVKKVNKELSRKLPAIIGMLIVWPLIGLWHGASVNFILYGCGFGILMIIGQLLGEKPGDSVIINTLKIVRTFLLTAFLLLIFRAETLDSVGIIIKGIVTWQRGISYIYTWSIVYLPFICLISIYAYLKNAGNGYYINMDMSKFISKVLFATAVLMAIVLMYVGDNFFVYFKF